MAADRFKRIGRLWKESRQESARGPNLRPLNMTIAARTRHLASHLPPVLHVARQIHSHLDWRIASLEFSKMFRKFHHMLRSSMAVHKLRAELPATQRKLCPFHTLSARLCPNRCSCVAEWKATQQIAARKTRHMPLRAQKFSHTSQATLHRPPLPSK